MFFFVAFSHYSFPDNHLTIVTQENPPLEQGEDDDSKEAPTRQEDIENLFLWSLVDCEEELEAGEAYSMRKKKSGRL